MSFKYAGDVLTTEETTSAPVSWQQADIDGFSICGESGKRLLDNNVSSCCASQVKGRRVADVETTGYTFTFLMC